MAKTSMVLEKPIVHDRHHDSTRVRFIDRVSRRKWAAMCRFFIQSKPFTTNVCYGQSGINWLTTRQGAKKARRRRCIEKNLIPIANQFHVHPRSAGTAFSLQRWKPSRRNNQEGGRAVDLNEYMEKVKMVNVLEQRWMDRQIELKSKVKSRVTKRKRPTLFH